MFVIDRTVVVSRGGAEAVSPVVGHAPGGLSPIRPGLVTDAMGSFGFG